jgi:hypothetical protein
MILVFGIGPEKDMVRAFHGLTLLNGSSEAIHGPPR